MWGFMADRIDHRIAASPKARESAARYHPGEYEIVPNGVLIPPHADPGGREHRIVFAGRHDRRKGLPVLLRAWPEIRRRTGATLRIAGADPLSVRLLLARDRVPDDGIEILGFLSQDDLTAELLSAKALVAPSLGGESFGMVLTRAFACATPVVASAIDGYTAVDDARDRSDGAARAIRQRSQRRSPSCSPTRSVGRSSAPPPGGSRRSATPGMRSRERLLEIYEGVTGRARLEVAAAR